jgi:hypothetical protein
MNSAGQVNSSLQEVSEIRKFTCPACLAGATVFYFGFAPPDCVRCLRCREFYYYSVRSDRLFDCSKSIPQPKDCFLKQDIEKYK